jgi:subtilisin family serine protease
MPPRLQVSIVFFFLSVCILNLVAIVSLVQGEQQQQKQQPQREEEIFLVHLKSGAGTAGRIVSSKRITGSSSSRRTLGGNGNNNQRQQVYDLLSSAFSSQQERLMEEMLQQHTRVFDALVIEPLWIQNTLIMTYFRPVQQQEEMNTIFTMFYQDLQAHPEVESIEKDSKVLTLFPQIKEEEIALNLTTISMNTAKEANANIKLLNAPQVWTKGIKGKGVVVASIDSGVRFSHEALVDNYRGTIDKAKSLFNHDYSYWLPSTFDPKNLHPDNADIVGHGTHTIATAVGKKGVGIAPEATWIAARAFDVHGAASKSDFLRAAQWVLCPTKMDGTEKDCSRGADVISNSFGLNRKESTTYDQWKWMNDVLDVWQKAGAYVVFAAGNTNGFQCESVYYPGSREESIAVGALIVGGGSLWGASGKGPGRQDDPSQPGTFIKPDFVAPGMSIRSAYSADNHKYIRLTGTSMATPHVSGAFALLLSAAKAFNDKESPPSHDILLELMRNTTTKGFSKPFLVASSCGGTKYNQYPNNIYGYGMPNLLEAVKALTPQLFEEKTASKINEVVVLA